jgi:hypothetical protein
MPCLASLFGQLDDQQIKKYAKPGQTARALETGFKLPLVAEAALKGCWSAFSTEGCGKI